MSKISGFFCFFFLNLCKPITTHSSEVQQRLEYWNEVRAQEQQKEGQCSWTTGRREETQKIKSERQIEARSFRSHLGVLNMERVLGVGSMIWFKQRAVHGNSQILSRDALLKVFGPGGHLAVLLSPLIQKFLSLHLSVTQDFISMFFNVSSRL